MRKAVFLIAALGLALAFAGCRGITSDLHDTHTITLNPGPYASVGGERTISLETDIWGRLPQLPTPQRVAWRFECEWRGGDIEVPVVNPYFDWNDPDLDWGNPNLAVIDRVTLPEIHGEWHIPVSRDADGNLHPGTPVAVFHGQAHCEHNGCQQWRWVHGASGEAAQFVGWFTAGGYAGGTSRVSERTVFTADTTLFARWLTLGEIEAGSVAAQIAALHTGGLPFAATITVNPGPADRVGPSDERIGPQLLYFGGREITITLQGMRETLLDYWGNPVYPPNESFTVLQLREPGAMFTVGRGVTLILRDVQVWGFDLNYTSAIVIENGGRVIIGDNAYVAYNSTFSTSYGGGITVQPGGELRMEGGRIFGQFVRHPRIGANLVMGGAGVWVRGGRFEMTGGSIGGLGIPLQANLSFGGGGAVMVSHGGHFEMTAGLIYDNMAVVGAGVFVSGRGGGIFDPGDFDVGLPGGTFAMRGVTVSSANGFAPDDLLDHYFDGIEGWDSPTPPWEGASIRNNLTFNWGGGVSVALGGRFDMHGGFIIDNEGWDGAGVHNDGTFIMHDGFIAFNDANNAAGISNWGHAEMWTGLILFNDGIAGAGIRNWGDFFMFDGHVTGNIGNGGPTGGIFNLGQFHMHGGSVTSNASNSQSGGISHGIIGMPYLGRFLITSGQVWNNRDLTTHHQDGLPGSIGNIRRQGGRPEAFQTARLGYFSLSPDLPSYITNDPTGWTVVSGVAPLFDGDDDLPGTGAAWDWYNTTGVIPAGRETVPIFWHVPPTPTYPARAHNLPLAVGRPRVEVNTRNNRSSVPAIVMNESLPIIRTTGGAISALPRGGVTFPSSLTTAQDWVTPATNQRRGYSWVISHGQMMTVDIGSVWSTGGVALNPVDIDRWPSPPIIQTLTVPVPPAGPDLFPWSSAAGAVAPLSQWHAPMLAPVRQEVMPMSPAMQELMDQRMRNLRTHPAPDINVAFERQQREVARRGQDELYLPAETLRIMEELAAKMMGRFGSDDGDGIVPFAW